MLELPHTTRCDHVEASEIAAAGTAVSGVFGHSAQCTDRTFSGSPGIEHLFAYPEGMVHAAPIGQPSLDDLGTPLSQVTFVVVDLETTGGSRTNDAITEIGAVKVRGGECLGTFETLVDPGMPVPPTITVLTGITESMLLAAPRIGEVLPAFLEFSRDAVLVAHNARFDIGFLNAALEAHGYTPLTNRVVDTVALARRLVRDEVPNVKLETLAHHFRTTTKPCHRAMADARATVDVLHGLLERAGTLGVLGLDDLLTLPTIQGHPSVGKLKLTTALPRDPGVYVFRDPQNRPLYIGKATNLRARVRSYFSSDQRRKVPQLLRETARIDHVVCRNALEAEVREIRLIQAHLPRYNRQAKSWSRYSYVKLTAERFPRLAVVRDARDDGAHYLGPFPARTAHAIREAIESALPLRRCTTRVAKSAHCAGDACLPALLGVAACPCRGHTTEAEYAAIVEQAVDGLTRDPSVFCSRLESRMHELARQERFEEAALARDRIATITRAFERQRRVDALRLASELEVAPGMIVRRGRLDLDDPELDAAPADGQWCPRDAIDELLAISRWSRTRRSVPA